MTVLQPFLRLKSVEDDNAIFGRKLRFLRHLSLTREGFLCEPQPSAYTITNIPKNKTKRGEKL